MIADLAVLFLVRANLAASAAILLVLLLRPVARRLLGPEVAYGLWALVPVAALTSLFPNLSDFRHGQQVGEPRFQFAQADLMFAAFLTGALVLLVLFVVSELRFRHLARAGRVGPAVVGLSWPSMVVPSDYESRFDANERALIRLHERTHIDRHHPRDNRLIALHQIFGWFNPLVHLAARCARLDQELACDAVVIEARPKQKRLYAETLLKGSRTTGPWSAFACALTEGGRHPLEVRIGCLARRPLTIRQFMIGAALVGSLGMLSAMSVWTLSPQSLGEREPYRTLPFATIVLSPAPDGKAYPFPDKYPSRRSYP
jgi:beta-lactamase regulating signal transducer with metallopeptidase domain